MLQKINENHMYTTIPPTLECYPKSNDCPNEQDYKEQYEMLFGNIFEENREFINYEDNYTNYLLNLINENKRI